MRSHMIAMTQPRPVSSSTMIAA